MEEPKRTLKWLDSLGVWAYEADPPAPNKRKKRVRDNGKSGIKHSFIDTVHTVARTTDSYISLSTQRL